LVLAAAAGAIALVTVAAVCIRAQPSARQLHVCHAGSLQAAFEELGRAFAARHPNVKIDDVSGGSVSLARRLASGTQACDIYASADYSNIDLMLKPAGLAGYTVMFARGRMVLAYLATDPKANGVAAAGNFTPPLAVPAVASGWYQKLLGAGVRVGGAHPFVDPGGYRAHMIFELAQSYYRVPGLYNALLEHYTIASAAGVLGKDFSFQFTYEHSAAAAAQRNAVYRYARLPDVIDLSAITNRSAYAQSRVTIPGLGIPGAASSVTIVATPAAWGLTIPRKSVNTEDAIAFVNLLLGPIGTAALNAAGPAPITPAIVSRDDSGRVPKSLKGLAIE